MVIKVYFLITFVECCISCVFSESTFKQTYCHRDSQNIFGFEIGFMKMTGIKVCETNENELILEPAVRWAGNPNITLALKFFSLQITVQVSF